MQLKLYKRSTLFLTLVVIADIISVACLIMFKDRWINNKVPTIVAFVLFVFALSTIYSYYDLNADKTAHSHSV